MKNIRITLGMLLTLALAPLAHADQIYIEQAQGSGASQGDLDTATDLIRASVTDASPSSQLVDNPGAADFSLKPRLVKLGGSYVLSVSKIKNGQSTFSSQLKAANIEELDKVALRVTQAVLSGKRAADDTRVGEVTDQEAKDGTQRRPVRHVTYVGIGGAALANLNAEHIGYDLGLATAWDTNTVLVKLMAELAGASQAVSLSGGVGLNYFFTMTDIAPYLGADFGYGGAKADGGSFFSGQTRGGFVLGVDGGVQILRTSAINLELGFRAGFLMNTNNYGRPAVYSLRVGLYF